MSRAWLFAAVLISVWCWPPGAGAVAPVGVLSLPGSFGPDGQLLAAAGGVVVGVGGGGGYVFVEPSGGWRSEAPAATLVDSGGATVTPTGAGVSNGIVVLNVFVNPYGTPFEDVFVRPVGGWSGTVSQSAQLVASDGAYLSGASVSGNTIVAAGTVGQRETAAYVFVEPPGGWSGTIHESAKLIIPPNPFPDLQWDQAVVSGSTIVVADGASSEVFTEPTGGWAGQPLPAATLMDWAGSPGGPVSISGSAVMSGFDVFTQPVGGWSGTVKPSAEISPHATGQWYPLCCQTMNGTTAALSGDQLEDDHQCLCEGRVWLFSAPHGRWTGPIVADPAVGMDETTGPVLLALDGGYLFTSGTNAINVYRLDGTYGHRPPHPQVSRASAAGIARARPRLQVRLTAADGADQIRSVSLTLPRGLTFRQHVRFAPLITFPPFRIPFTTAGAGRTLRISIPTGTPVLLLRIPATALMESPSLRRATRRSAHHHMPVTLQLKITDLWGTTRTITVHLHAE